MDRMDIYIRKEEMNKLIRDYLLTDGKEIVFSILKDYYDEYSQKNIVQKKEYKEIVDSKSEDMITKEDLKELFKDFIAFDEEDTEKMALSKVKELIIKLFDLNEDIKELNKNLKNENDSYLQNIKNLKIKEESLNEKIRDLEKDYSNAQEKVIYLNREIQTAEKNAEEKEMINRKLRAEKENLEQSNSAANKKAQELKAEIGKLENDKENLNKKLYKLDGVEILQKLYEHYLEISDDYRKKLENLIKTDDISSFIACCYNIGTMDDLWDSLNVEIRNGNTRDAYILREIFEYFVIQQNKKYDENLYKIMTPEIGEEFDPTKHLAAGGNSSGKIEEVIFPGYGIMESKSSPEQEDSERKIRKIRKLAIVKVR